MLQPIQRDDARRHMARESGSDGFGPDGFGPTGFESAFAVADPIPGG